VQFIIPSHSCFGDNVAHFTPAGATFISPDHHSRAVLNGKSNGYSIFRDDALIYEISDPRISYRNGELLLSNDGHLVAWILLNGFLGHLDSSPDQLKAPAVEIFHDGKRSKSYSLKWLLVRPVLVKETASHTFWRRDVKGGDIFQNAAGDEVNFETTSFRLCRVDLRKGILDAKDDPLWVKQRLVVFGKFTPSPAAERSFEISDLVVLKGRLSRSRINAFDESKTYPSFKGWAKRSYWCGAALREEHGAYFIDMPFSNFSPRLVNGQFNE